MKHISMVLIPVIFSIPLVIMGYAIGKRVERHRTIAEVLYYDWISSRSNAANEAAMLQGFLLEMDSTPKWMRHFGRPKFGLKRGDLDSMSESIYEKFESSNKKSASTRLRSPQGIAEVLKDSYR